MPVRCWAQDSDACWRSDKTVCVWKLTREQDSYGQPWRSLTGYVNENLCGGMRGVRFSLFHVFYPRGIPLKIDSLRLSCSCASTVFLMKFCCRHSHIVEDVVLSSDGQFALSCSWDQVCGTL